jgi:hypothetical protein
LLSFSFQWPSDPPIHTNGILVTDACIRDFHYQFFEIGADVSEIPEWESTIKQSAAVIFVIDQNGMEMNHSHTRALLEKTVPIIQQKRIPTAIIWNKKRAQTARGPRLTEVIEPYFGSLPHFCLEIGRLNEELFSCLRWISAQKE